MSEQPVKPPSRRRLIQVGAIAGAVALAVVVAGVAERVLGGRAVAQQTASQSVPTVALARLTGGEATEALTLPGAIQPYNRAMIHARVSGYLKGWNQDIGAQVRAGQLLATIDAPDLDQQYQQAKADHATAVANSRVANLTAARWQALLPSASVSQQEADEKAGDAAAKKALVDAARANLRRLEVLAGFKRIVAPFDGVVTARKTDIGALITAGSQGEELFEVSDLKRVRIYVRAPQSLSAELRPGQPATFNLPQYPGQSFKAAVVATSRAIDPTSRTLLVQLQADNADGKLFGGAYCQVHFQLAGSPDTIRVPATALLPVNSGAKVAVLGPGDKVMLKSVQLGRDLGDSVEIVAGLTRSDRVIDSPPESLRNGEQVKLAPTPAPAARGK